MKNRGAKTMRYEVRDEVGYAVAVLGGDVDLSTSPQAREVILAALNDGKNLLVDLSGVSYLDSSGVATLVEGFQLARNKRRKFGLVGVSDNAMSVLKLARLDTVFPIFATESEFSL
jgi:anti-sigma B factor antagonist